MTDWLRCAIKGRNFEKHYEKMGRERLLRARKNLWMHEVIPALCWATAILLLALLVPEKKEVFFLFVALAGYSVVAVTAETRKRRLAIERALGNPLA